MHRSRAEAARKEEFPSKPGLRESAASLHYLTFSSSTDVVAGYNYGSMPRVGEFCPSNIARLLLGVVIAVTLMAAIGVWLFHSPGRGAPIEQPHAAEPAR
jgi:hypothetical protein